MAAAEPVPEPVGLQLGTRGRETADVTEGQVEAQPCRAYFGQSSNLHFSVRAEITGGIPVASDSLDRGAWRAMIHSVTKSRTGLKQFSTHTQGSLGSTLELPTVGLFLSLRMKVL